MQGVSESRPWESGAPRNPPLAHVVLRQLPVHRARRGGDEERIMRVTRLQARISWPSRVLQDSVRSVFQFHSATSAQFVDQRGQMLASIPSTP